MLIENIYTSYLQSHFPWCSYFFLILLHNFLICTRITFPCDKSKGRHKQESEALNTLTLGQRRRSYEMHFPDFRMRFSFGRL